MGIRDKLRKDAAQYLDPGEQIQAAFYAKRPSMEYNDRAVVATDRRLLLLELNFRGRVTGLLGEAPRDIKLGPCRGFMHPITAFGIGLAVHRRFFKDVAEADRVAESRTEQSASSMTTEDGLGPAKVAKKYVFDPGFFTDPGGQAGIRYWNGREWSPLFPLDLPLADPGKVGNFSGEVPLPLPERDGSWLYAAQMARKAGASTAAFAALTALLLTVTFTVHPARGLWIVGALSAFRTIGQWRVRNRWNKLDRAATGPLDTGDSIARSRTEQTRCLECGAESAEATEACASCGATGGLPKPAAPGQ